MDKSDIIEALKSKVAEDRVFRGHQQPDRKQEAFEEAVEAACELLAAPAPAEAPAETE